MGVRARRASMLAVLWMAIMACMALLQAPAGHAEDRFIVMASTTSTEQSGLFNHLLPLFKQASGIEVRVVAVGTGQAIDMARRGDADIAFVHDTAAEEKFVAEGFALKRQDVMYNDFVLVGPMRDPAGVRGGRDAVDALRKIAAISAKFISRGDESGTHEMEKSYWKAAGLEPRGAWYVSAGQGMGPVLTMAAELTAYTLTDRATYAAYRDRTGLQVLVEGDPHMFNPYGVITLSPLRYPNLNHAGAQAFAEWLTSAEGQAAVASFRINGVQMFFPSARR